MFFMLALTFAHVGYLLFGRMYSNFKTFTSSFIYSCGMLRLRGKDHLSGLFHDGNPVVGMLYLALYITGMFVVLRGLVSLDSVN